MASANALPRIRKHDNDGAHAAGGDAGRYGSSRDHYVSQTTHAALLTDTDNSNVRSLHEMTAVGIETEIEETVEGEIVTTHVAVIGDDQDHRMEGEGKGM